MIAASIRPETPADISAISHVIEQSCGPAEAHLVEALRDGGKAVLSLVTVHEEHVVGHILFSSVLIETAGGAFDAVSLAPMGVLPHLQRQGIGSALVRAGLEVLRTVGHTAVIVLGHAEFYPRFGFVPASSYGITSHYDVPDEVFMAQELAPGALTGKSGTVKYGPEFDSL